MGSGKTWFLSRLFNKLPPSLYTSTGIAEQSYRGLLHHIGNISAMTWQQFSKEMMLEFLAIVFHEDLPPADVVRLAEDIARMDPTAGSAPLALPSAPTVTPSVTTARSSSLTPSSASAVVPKPVTPAKESETSKSMMRLVKAPKSSVVQAMLELIHMIDTGGQPELMENMPTIINHCHLAVIVLNLLYGVDDYPPVDFHKDGKAYKRALPSHYTNRQMIQKLASTLQAKGYSLEKGQCFRLVSVATHMQRLSG